MKPEIVKQIRVRMAERGFRSTAALARHMGYSGYYIREMLLGRKTGLPARIKLAEVLDLDMATIINA